MLRFAGFCVLLGCATAQPAVRPSLLAIEEPSARAVDVAERAKAIATENAASSRRVLVYFYSRQCHPCLDVQAALESPGAPEALRGWTVLKVNLDEYDANSLLGERITGIPRLLKLARDGTHVVAVLQGAGEEHERRPAERQLARILAFLNAP